ncbi:MAG: FadR family transcriptional regulator [Myxococcales bacterium]|nr:FadR family transcriptional regulator [Myxococcales bacterium]
MLSADSEVKRVVDALLERILTGAYPAGLRLPAETELAVALGCGRSTVREALRHLGDLGLVRSRRGSGAMVLDFRREGTPALLPAYIRLGRFDASPTVIARELLRMRTFMAGEAVRLAARYASHESLVEVARHVERAPALERDPVAHAANELELYRAFVLASGMWPAAWLANAFWAPMREVHAVFAPLLAAVPPGFQRYIERLLALVERREEDQAAALVQSWFEGIDGALLHLFEAALGAAESAGAARARGAAPASSRASRADEARPHDSTPATGS